MDKIRILETLGLHETGIIKLTHLDILLWGRTLQFRALVEVPDGDDVLFELNFDDCRELRWQVYSHTQHASPEAFPATELLNFQIGRSQHRSPARLLTEHFGLSLFYGTLQLIHNRQVTTLE